MFGKAKANRRSVFKFCSNQKNIEEIYFLSEVIRDHKMNHNYFCLKIY
ncbi:hypothetical protein DESC_810062 [Desulfosarcina cetonica]|nr:hypothetical protein DESC_810062 [Desulfosarcina cetonica]